MSTSGEPGGGGATGGNRSPSQSQEAGTEQQQEYEGYNGSMSQYCKGLEQWLTKSYWHRECALSAYYSALSMMYPMYFPPPGSTNLRSNINQQQQHAGAGPGLAGVFGAAQAGAAVGGQQQRQPVIRQILIRGIRVNGNPLGIDYNVAPLWKRIVAECIDFFILLIVKVFVTVTIIDAFDLFDLDNIDLDALQASDTLLEMAYSLSFTQLITLELTHRLVVCFIEAYCLFKGGATPGKNVMGLRVLHCETILPIGPNINNNQDYFPVGGVYGAGSRVIVAPGSLLSFPRALLRSVIKNFSLAFFFPFCFTLFHFEYSRTLYDLSAKSIVVEVQQRNNNLQ